MFIIRSRDEHISAPDPISFGGRATRDRSNPKNNPEKPFWDENKVCMYVCKVTGSNTDVEYAWMVQNH